jgi:exosortase B
MKPANTVRADDTQWVSSASPDPASAAGSTPAALTSPSAAAPLRQDRSFWSEWLPIPLDVLVLVLAVPVMYLPTLYLLLGTSDAALWQKGEHSHGPIMLMVATWLLFKRVGEYAQSQPDWRDGPIKGQWLAWPLMILGAVMFIAGRSLGIIYIELGSFIPVLMSVLTLIGGTRFLMALKFPVFFFVFMVPLPGFLIDGFSQFIKLWVSVVSTEILWHVGYPISHTGVIMSIGQYQLLVADACAGMRTLFMLEALGIFYINVVRHSSLVRNVALAILIVPISFTANCIRVMFLALLTYHFGDEVGQGFLHGFAGMVLFLVALMLTLAVDSLLRAVAARLERRRKGVA